MSSKFETVFRTYSYRLYPTKMQQLELKALFDLQDHAFNGWADLANRGVAQGKAMKRSRRRSNPMRFSPNAGRIVMHSVSLEAMY